jgi:hypothetical protein
MHRGSLHPLSSASTSFFCDKRHPAELGAAKVSAFISHLALGRKVDASTQTQALSALLFLYREVLALSIGWVDDVERAKKPKRPDTGRLQAQRISFVQGGRRVLTKLRGRGYPLSRSIALSPVKVRLRHTHFYRGAVNPSLFLLSKVISVQVNGLLTSPTRGHIVSRIHRAHNSPSALSASNRRMTTRLYWVGKNNWLKLIRLEHSNEKKSHLGAIDARRSGRRISEVHPKRGFEFI